jgi:hypothetical protein
MIEIIKETNIKKIEAIAESETQDGVFYKLEAIWNKDDWEITCSCPAGRNRGHCKHMEEFEEKLPL